MEDTIITTNGVDLHVIQAGPVDGDLVILLHGFPEFWYGWRNQISPLAAAGYRLWVPDQRGYNTSSKPRKISAYSLDQLSRDVIGLIDAAGVKQAIIVGHDWGAGVAWWTAQNYPDRISRMVIMNVPHGAVMKKHLTCSFKQIRKSWYMFFFQIPFLPEYFARRNDWQMTVNSLRHSSRPGVFPPEDIAEYKRAWAQPGAYRAMVNWYRAMMRRSSSSDRSRRIKVPTLLIWGAKDRFLGREMAQPSINLCDQGQLVFIEEASHWVQHEEPDRVNRLILDFFQNERIT